VRHPTSSRPRDLTSWTISSVGSVASTRAAAWLVYRIGFVDGLFTSHPAWQPR
jgi:hypothetical protein